MSGLRDLVQARQGSTRACAQRRGDALREGRGGPSSPRQSIDKGDGKREEGQRLKHIPDVRAHGPPPPREPPLKPGAGSTHTQVGPPPPPPNHHRTLSYTRSDLQSPNRPSSCGRSPHSPLHPPQLLDRRLARRPSSPNSPLHPRWPVCPQRSNPRASGTRTPPTRPSRLSSGSRAYSYSSPASSSSLSGEPSLSRSGTGSQPSTLLPGHSNLARTPQNADCISSR